jgi:hypothetical protein
MPTYYSPYSAKKSNGNYKNDDNIHLDLTTKTFFIPENVYNPMEALLPIKIESRVLTPEGHINPNVYNVVINGINRVCKIKSGNNEERPDIYHVYNYPSTLGDTGYRGPLLIETVSMGGRSRNRTKHNKRKRRQSRRKQ